MNVINSPFISIILYFIVLQIFTLLGLPIGFYCFKKNRDLGYIFYRLIGLVILAYVVWLGASLKLISFTWLTLSILTSVMLFLSFIFIKKEKKILINEFCKKKKTIFIQEMLFWLFFFLFLFIRYKNPDLWHPVMGGEKPMDFAFLNAILRSKVFPPFDPWFAGESINYYYFGQYLIAVITKITNIPSSISYNLALSFLFAQTAISFLTIVFNITGSVFLGVIGSIFGVISGNLAQIPVILKNLSSRIPINGWYWTATRVMPNGEINEFPFFTFLYADLHSHLIAIPIALLVIAVLLSLFLDRLEIDKTFIIKTVLLSLLLGILRAGNSWDYPSYLFLSLSFLFLKLFEKKNANFLGIVKIVFSSLLLIILSNFLIFPFLMNYKTGSLGLSFYDGVPTRLSDYYIIHGLFLFIAASFFLILKLTNKKRFIDLFGKPSVIFLFLTTLFFFFTLKLWFLLFIFVCLCLSIFPLLLLLLKKDQETFENPIIIILLLFCFAFLFTLIPDVFNSTLSLGRMNTVFKFYLQAWLFFSLASACSLKYIFLFLKNKSKFSLTVWLIIFIIFFTATLSYPVTASWGKITDRMSTDAPPGLDGMEYMKHSSYYDQNKKLDLIWDYKAISWINQTIKGSPVILEANTPIYRWGSRVSIYTGLPTIIGWDWHEIAHRSYLTTDEVGKRTRLVKTAYETKSTEELLSILRQFQVKYIYLGELERAYYDSDGLRKFVNLTGRYLDVVYKNPGVTIYEVIND